MTTGIRKELSDFMSASRKFGAFGHDRNGNIISIHGRELKVENLSENNEGKPYFQAWVDGAQDDGYTHNEAVENALKRAIEAAAKS
ncbi:MAG: hypothetical protein V7749_01035 [Cocleimonas sp.]